ncbi:MAG: hypothetical protein OEY78_05075 [Gammaproteobacteria bacterium]|nr:hypothetical protein [Gammaproteobacteria bacterium]
MKKFVVRFSFLISLSLMLSACFGPSTPQEVGQDFWQAVLENDKSDVVEHSTLTDEKYYDRFSKDWTGFQLSFGKLVIDQQAASIDTKLAAPTNSDQDSRRFTTYLVLHDEKWKVDYERTAQSIKGGVLGELFSALNQVGNELSRKIQSSADSFSREIEHMGKELEQLSREFEQQASENMEKYAEQMRKSIEALEESINRALEQEDNHLSDEDKRVLKVLADDLKKDSEKLSSPSIKTVKDGSQHMSETYTQLEMINNDAFDKYKSEWRALSQQYKETMRKMMDDLSVQSSRNNNG